MAGNLSRDASKKLVKKRVKIFSDYRPKPAIAMAAKPPAAGLVIRTATVGCPAYAGNGGGSPDAPVAYACGPPV